MQVDAVALDPVADGWSKGGDAEDNFARLLGPLWHRGEGVARQFAFVVEDKHLSINERAHGGAMMWLLDKSLSQVTRAACGHDNHLVTVQLDVHFIDGVKLGRLVQSHGEVTRVTRSLVFTTGKLTSDGKVLATASGVWRYRPPAARP